MIYVIMGTGQTQRNEGQERKERKCSLRITMKLQVRTSWNFAKSS